MVMKYKPILARRNTVWYELLSVFPSEMVMVSDLFVIFFKILFTNPASCCFFKSSLSSFVTIIGFTQWHTQKIFMAEVLIQWHMVVICIYCVLFVTSQFDVIFMFPNQRFGEGC